MSRSVLRYRVLFPNKEDILFVCAHFFLFTLFSLLFLNLSLLPNFFSFSSLSHQRPQLLVMEYLIKGKREKHFNPFDLAFCLRFLFFLQPIYISFLLLFFIFYFHVLFFFIIFISVFGFVCLSLSCIECMY